MGKVTRQYENSSNIKRSSEKIGLVEVRENERQLKMEEVVGLDVVLSPLETTWFEKSQQYTVGDSRTAAPLKAVFHFDQFLFSWQTHCYDSLPCHLTCISFCFGLLINKCNKEVAPYSPSNCTVNVWFYYLSFQTETKEEGVLTLTAAQSTGALPVLHTHNKTL